MTPPATDYTAWRFWVDMAVLLGVIANTLYTWWSSREKVNGKRFARLEDEVKKRLTAEALKSAVEARDGKCAQHQSRTDSMEASLRGMPSRNEIAGLSAEINHLTQNLGRIEGRLDGLNRVADLINEFLINQGGTRK